MKPPRRLKPISGGGGEPPPPEPPASSPLELEAEIGDQPVSVLTAAVVAKLVSIISQDRSVPAAKAAAAMIHELEVSQEGKLHHRRLELLLATKSYGALTEYLALIGATREDVYALIGEPPDVDIDEHFERGLLKARLERLAVARKKSGP